MIEKNDRLRIALSKGFLLEESLELLEKVGEDVDAVRKSPRQLFFSGKEADFIVARAADVPAYVTYGAADLGLVGKDILLESDYDVFELLDLGYGGCRFVVAGRKDATQSIEEDYHRLGSLRVATKFPKVTKDYYETRGIQAEIIKLYGSIELAPIVGLSDVIVDLTATGKTLAENNLRVIDVISSISCRLIANYVSYKLKSTEIETLVDRIGTVLGLTPVSRR